MRNKKKINLLRLQLNVCSSSAPHNNFTLSTKDIYNITVCSFDEPELDTPKNIKIYHRHNYSWFAIGEK